MKVQFVTYFTLNDHFSYLNRSLSFLNQIFTVRGLNHINKNNRKLYLLSNIKINHFFTYVNIMSRFALKLLAFKTDTYYFATLLNKYTIKFLNYLLESNNYILKFSRIKQKNSKVFLLKIKRNVTRDSSLIIIIYI